MILFSMYSEQVLLQPEEKDGLSYITTDLICCRCSCPIHSLRSELEKPCKLNLSLLPTSLSIFNFKSGFFCYAQSKIHIQLYITEGNLKTAKCDAIYLETKSK